MEKPWIPPTWSRSNKSPSMLWVLSTAWHTSDNSLLTLREPQGLWLQIAGRSQPGLSEAKASPIDQQKTISSRPKRRQRVGCWLFSARILSGKEWQINMEIDEIVKMWHIFPQQTEVDPLFSRNFYWNPYRWYEVWIQDPNLSLWISPLQKPHTSSLLNKQP